MRNVTPQPVVDYLATLRRDPHPHLAAIDREGQAEGLPLVYPDTGALLQTLVRACGARRILEIGTAIGYTQGGYETGPTASHVAPEVEGVLMKGIAQLLQVDTAKLRPLR